MNKNKKKKLRNALAILQEVGVNRMIVALELEEGLWETSKQISERSGIDYSNVRYTLEKLKDYKVIQSRMLERDPISGKRVKIWSANENTKRVTEALTAGLT